MHVSLFRPCKQCNTRITVGGVGSGDIHSFFVMANNTCTSELQPSLLPSRVQLTVLMITQEHMMTSVNTNDIMPLASNVAAILNNIVQSEHM